MFANFRSQARVIDLLGREQIADSPTALGESFKNALDAADSKVWVDYKDDRDLLTIRDNGLGMPMAEVTDNWLVLATDSSHLPKECNEGWAMYATEEQVEWLERPRYGEKGIGRLSVAILARLAVRLQNHYLFRKTQREKADELDAVVTLQIASLRESLNHLTRL